MMLHFSLWTPRTTLQLTCSLPYLRYPSASRADFDSAGDSETGLRAPLAATPRCSARAHSTTVELHLAERADAL